MPTDIHAHYVPPRVLDVLRDRGSDFGVALIAAPRAAGNTSA